MFKLILAYIIFIVLLVSIQHKTALSYIALCANERCDAAVSEGETTQFYPNADESFLKLKPHEKVKIFSKSKDKIRGKDGLLKIELNGSSGYAYSKFIKETKIIVKTKDLKEVDLPDPHVSKKQTKEQISHDKLPDNIGENQQLPSSQTLNDVINATKSSLTDTTQAETQYIISPSNSESDTYTVVDGTRYLVIDGTKVPAGDIDVSPTTTAAPSSVVSQTRPPFSQTSYSTISVTQSSSISVESVNELGKTSFAEASVEASLPATSIDEAANVEESVKDNSSREDEAGESSSGGLGFFDKVADTIVGFLGSKENPADSEANGHEVSEELPKNQMELGVRPSPPQLVTSLESSLDLSTTTDSVMAASYVPEPSIKEEIPNLTVVQQSSKMAVPNVDDTDDTDDTDDASKESWQARKLNSKTLMDIQDALEEGQDGDDEDDDEDEGFESGDEIDSDELASTQSQDSVVTTVPSVVAKDIDVKLKANDGSTSLEQDKLKQDESSQLPVKDGSLGSGGTPSPGPPLKDTKPETGQVPSQDIPPQSGQDKTPDFPPQSVQDNTPDVPPQSGQDKTPDVPRQWGQDKTPDVPPQSGQDKTPDGPPQSVQDKTPDIASQSGQDKTPDIASQSGQDKTPDVPPQSVQDKTPDIASQSGQDKTPETVQIAPSSSGQNKNPKTVEVAQPTNPEPLQPTNPEPLQPTNPEPLQPTNPDPVQPNNPDPVQPNNPDPVQPNNPDPVQPNNPDPVQPNNPEPVQPNNPEPVQPNNPEPVQPNNPEPVQPNNPEPVQPKNPDPVQPKNPEPVHPNNPEPVQPNNPDSVHSNNPETGKTQDKSSAGHEIPDPLVNDGHSVSRDNPMQSQDTKEDKISANTKDEQLPTTGSDKTVESSGANSKAFETNTPESEQDVNPTSKSAIEENASRPAAGSTQSQLGQVDQQRVVEDVIAKKEYPYPIPKENKIYSAQLDLDQVKGDDVQFDPLKSNQKKDGKSDDEVVNGDSNSVEKTTTESIPTTSTQQPITQTVEINEQPKIISEPSIASSQNVQLIDSPETNQGISGKIERDSNLDLVEETSAQLTTSTVISNQPPTIISVPSTPSSENLDNSEVKDESRTDPHEHLDSDSSTPPKFTNEIAPPVPEYTNYEEYLSLTRKQSPKEGHEVNPLDDLGRIVAEESLKEEIFEELSVEPHAQALKNDPPDVESTLTISSNVENTDNSNENQGSDVEDLENSNQNEDLPVVLRSYVQSALNSVPDPLHSALMDLKTKGLSPGATFLTFSTGFLLVLLISFVLIIKRSNKEGHLLGMLCKTEERLFKIGTENTLLKDELERTKIEIAESNETLRRNEEELEALKIELSQSQNQNSAFTAAVQNLQAQLDGQRETIGALRDTAQESAQQNGVLQERLVEAERQSQEQLNVIERLEETLKETKSKLEASEDSQMDSQSRCIRLEQEKEQLLREAIEWNERVLELSKQTETYAQNQEDFQKALDLKQKEIDLLNEAIKKVEDLDQDKNGLSSEQYEELVKSLVDVSQLSLDLKNVQNERDLLKTQLDCEKERGWLLDTKMQEVEKQMAEAKDSYKAALRERTEALNKLEVLTNYFKEKEALLQKELGAQEVMRQQKEYDADSSGRRLVLLMEENETFKKQVQSLKQELEETERSYKNLVSTHEKKAHENWLAARGAERKLEEAKREATLLRQRLTLAERDSNESNEMIVRPLPKKVIARNGDVTSPPLEQDAESDLTDASMELDHSKPGVGGGMQFRPLLLPADRPVPPPPPPFPMPPFGMPPPGAPFGMPPPPPPMMMPPPFPPDPWRFGHPGMDYDERRTGSPVSSRGRMSPRSFSNLSRDSRHSSPPPERRRDMFSPPHRRRPSRDSTSPPPHPHLPNFHDMPPHLREAHFPPGPVPPPPPPHLGPPPPQRGPPPGGHYDNRNSPLVPMYGGGGGSGGGASRRNEQPYPHLYNDTPPDARRGDVVTSSPRASANTTTKDNKSSTAV